MALVRKLLLQLDSGRINSFGYRVLVAALHARGRLTRHELRAAKYALVERAAYRRGRNAIG